MVAIELIDINYYTKKYELTDIIAITEGIEFIIKRGDSTIYSKKYELQTDGSNILFKRQKDTFMYNIISMYHMFISDKTPKIKAENMEELAIKIKESFKK